MSSSLLPGMGCQDVQAPRAGKCGIKWLCRFSSACFHFLSEEGSKVNNTYEAPGGRVMV